MAAAQTFALVQPVGADFDLAANPTVIVLVAHNGSAKFALDANLLRSKSDFIKTLVPEESAERSVNVDQDFADATTLQLLVTWVEHYVPGVPGLKPLSYPVPSVANPRVLFNAFDGQLLGQHICRDWNPAGPDGGVPQLYRLARLALFLGIKPLMRLCIGLVAHFVNKCVRDAGNDGDTMRVARSWFGVDEPYAADQKREILEWVCKTVDGINLTKRENALDC